MSDKFLAAMRLIDEAHSQDPRLIPNSTTTTTTTTTTSSGNTSSDISTNLPSQIPYELHYARKMTSYLHLRSPTASEPLQLAVRAQHLKRWEVPRGSFPATKIGYHSWRRQLQRRQAELAEGICRECGFSEEVVRRVGGLVRKEGVRSAAASAAAAKTTESGMSQAEEDNEQKKEGGSGEDEEAQILEDVACLVFLDDQFEEFEKAHDEEKILGILRKTWLKMSPKGRELALNIHMSDRARGLVEMAVAGT